MRVNLKTCACLVILYATFLCSANARAQLRVSHQYIPSSCLKNPIPRPSIPADAGYTFHTSEFSLTFPIVFFVEKIGGRKVPKRFLVNRFRYRLTQGKLGHYQGLTPVLPRREKFHSLGYRGMWVEPMSQNWSGLVLGGVYMAVDEVNDVPLSNVNLQVGLLVRRHLDSGGRGPKV